MVSQASSLTAKIRAAKFVSDRTREARYGGALDNLSDYTKIAVKAGFDVRDAVAIGARSMVASEQQIGQCPVKTFDQDRKWTKL